MKIKFYNSYIDLESVLAITREEESISFELFTGQTLIKTFNCKKGSKVISEELFNLIKPHILHKRYDVIIDTQCTILKAHLYNDSATIIEYGGESYIVDRIKLKNIEDTINREALNEFNNLCDSVISKWEKLKGVSSYLESL